MTFANATSFAAQPVPLIDAEGRDVVVAIVKATFEIDADGNARRAEAPSPVRVNDVPYVPDDPKSCLKYPTDVTFAKRGTDVVVIGEAVSKTPVQSLDVAVRIRERTIALRVHGTRVYYSAPTGLAVAPALPFERMPITYEKAYGGATDDWSYVEMRNPSGVGVAKKSAELIGKPAPQIEDPAHPHVPRSEKNAVVGLGALMTHWSPRRELAGTYDAKWQEERMPLVPIDFDLRANNVAHPLLQFDPPLRAGDPIAILGMTFERFVFALPALPIVFHARYDVAGRVERRVEIDTVLIEPTTRRVEIVARQAFPMGRGKDVLRELVVDPDA